MIYTYLLITRAISETVDCRVPYALQFLPKVCNGLKYGSAVDALLPFVQVSTCLFLWSCGVQLSIDGWLEFSVASSSGEERRGGRPVPPVRKGLLLPRASHTAGKGSV